MGWATHYITKLKSGETVTFRPRGHSMKGKIESGELCTVEPIEDFANLQKDDPFRLDFGFTDTYVDLGAEKVITADKNDEKIAIEIKSFISKS